MRERQMICACALAAFTMIACDKSDGEAKGDESPAGSVDEAVNKAVDDAAQSAGAGQLFDKELRKKACEILTPTMVSKMLSVPEPELKQMKIMGCIYSWNEKGGDGTAEARFTTIMAHKSEERARQWFSNATKSLTEEEAKKQMAMVTKKTKEHESINSKLKEKTVDQVGGILAEHAKGGVKYEPVKGLGDEAAINLSDGALTVRVGNLTFSVAGYSGTKMPPPKFESLSVKEITKVSMKAQKEWAQKTMPERKAMGIKVAKAVVKGLAD